MKIGAAAWGFRELPLGKQLKICRENGLYSLELGIANAPKDLPLCAGTEQLNRVRKAYEQAGVQLECAATGDDFMMEEEEKVQIQVSKVQKVIEICSFLQIPYLRIFAGFVPLGQMTEKLWKHTEEALDECAAFAAQRKVVLAVETHGAVLPYRSGIRHVDTITTDLSSLERLKREIRDDILFVPDGANLAATRHMNVEEYYRLLSGRIAYSHIKNFRRTEDGSIEPSSVGDGILDWKPLLTVLCSQRIPTDGFAEQNGRDAERAD
jgi:sugar phosphate isomerase/epimerase